MRSEDLCPIHVQYRNQRAIDTTLVVCILVKIVGIDLPYVGIIEWSKFELVSCTKSNMAHPIMCHVEYIERNGWLLES